MRFKTNLKIISYLFVPAGSFTPVQGKMESNGHKFITPHASQLQILSPTTEFTLVLYLRHVCVYIGLYVCKELYELSTAISLENKLNGNA